MAEVTAALVKQLRDMTGAGMMDCKKALAENDGEIEAAVDWLRAKGLSKAAKKADRAAAEGLVAFAGAGTSGVLVEFNAETDFVARNEGFQTAARQLAQIAIAHKGDLEAVKAAPSPDGEGVVSDMITRLIATIGENMTLRRSAYLSVDSGVVAHYVHGAVSDGLGKIGVLVALESTGERGALADLGRKIAMHVAAANPIAATEADISAERIEREKSILVEQIKQDPKAAGKPQQVIDKMLEGRLRKFMEEVVLVKQAFVHNPDQTVEAALKEGEKAIGAPIRLIGFSRLQLGEGVEKKADDFAAEVAAMSGGAG